MSAPVDRRLGEELARTLRDEIGARCLYARLAPRAHEQRLRDVLAALAEESQTLVERLAVELADLGLGARRASARRALAARAWSLVARAGARRLVLRLCLESEEVLARRYPDLARALRAQGATSAARACEVLAGRKAARARTLLPWVPR